MFRNTLLEPSLNIFSIIKNLLGREIHKGDLVLVSEDNLARGQWQRARVEATHPGRDGLIRSVTLRLTSGSLTRRPVQRLHLFEACDADLAAELD